MLYRWRVRLEPSFYERRAPRCSGVLKPCASLHARSIAFGTLISAVSKGMLKPTADRQTHWNFGDPHGNPVSLEEFLAQQ